jgi:hypothetical protein
MPTFTRLFRVFVLLLPFVLQQGEVLAQLGLYSFQQSTGSFSPITGGTVVATATGLSGSTALDDVVYTIPSGTIPFDFRFNPGSGQANSYSGFSLSSNGYITFGSTAPTATSYTPLSASTGYSGALSPFGRNLIGVYDPANTTVAQIRTETLGVAPNRRFVVQWANFKPSTQTGTGTCSFQLHLLEGSNAVEFHYSFSGTFTLSGSTPAQVGMRGGSNTAYANRLVASGTAWTSSSAGTANSSSCTITATQLPPDGLVYAWTCPPPSSASYRNSTKVQSELFWTSNGAGSYYIEWGPNGFTQGTGTSINTTDTFLLITGLSASSTYQYYLRKTCSSAADTLGPFTFKTGTDGEDCLTAIQVPTAGSLATCINQTVTNGISSNGPTCVCTDAFGGAGANDTWLKFTAPAAGDKKIIVHTQAGTINDWIMEVWNGCPGTTGAEVIGCSDDSVVSMPVIALCQNQLVAGNSYYIRAWPYASFLTGTMSLCVYGTDPCPIPPANDECDFATLLPVKGVNGCTGDTSTFTTRYATPTTGAGATIACDATTLNDVYFRFNTGNLGTLRFNFTKLSALSLKAAIVFECGGAQIECFNPANGPFVVSGLNPFADYYLRVWSNANEGGTFRVCIEDLCDDPTAVLSGSGAVCAGIGSSLRVDFTGNAPWTFTYNNGTSNQSITTSSNPAFIPVNPTANSTYTAVSVSGPNCSGTVSGSASIIVLPSPTVSLAAQPDICSNQSISLTGGSPAGGSYSGTGASGGMFNGTTSGAGTFSITYTYTGPNGCNGSDSKPITVTQQPVLTGFTPTSGTPGTVVSLSGSGFTPTSSVHFNGIAASVTYISSGSLTALVPSGASTGSVQVSNGSCQSTGNTFTVGGGSIQAQCRNISAYLNAGGSVSISASAIDNGSSSPAGIASLSISPNTFNCSQTGAQSVVLTVTDNNGSSANCTATVTVLDTIKPIVSCKAYGLTLSNGNAVLQAADIDNGSTDNCSITQLTASPNSFTSPGVYTVVLSATDASGNTASCTAQVTVSAPPPSTLTLQVRCFIEGYYTTAATMNTVLLNAGVGSSTTEADTIEVLLCAAGNSSNITAVSRVVLSTSGFATAIFPGSLLGTSQYISLRHRNAVRVWSANPVTLTSSTTYDFSSSAEQSFGNNQCILPGGYFGLFSGDIEPQDDVIDVLDQGLVDNDNSLFAFGYIPTDVNGDGVVDVLDQMIIDNNVGDFIGTIQP